jgi:uncharacterized cupredoxin-like copper-binding protein
VIKRLAFALVALGPLALASCVPGAEARERTIEISIRHSRFSPERLEIERGTTVRFVVHNRDPIAHEFIVGDEHVQLVHENGTEKHHGAKPGEVSIPAGRTRSTIYTFSGSADLIFGCHLPGHYAYGMRGVIALR